MNLQECSKSATTEKAFPRSILSVSREEFGDYVDNPDAKHPPLQLMVKEGLLPSDLHGHVFIISAVGSVDSRSCSGTEVDSDAGCDKEVVCPTQDGYTPFYNGDGMVYRFDFDNLEAGVFLTTRIMKTPCYYADAITNTCESNLRFKNLGIMRMSKQLGIRNQLNTGFLPMKVSDEEGNRLLVTWDIGRPYEIDTKTLELVTPVGWDKNWKAINPLLAVLPLQPPFPFKLVHTSAHPCFDFHKKEMFTVNLGRSLTTFLSQLRPRFDFHKKEMFTVNLSRSLTTFLSRLRPLLYWGVDVVKTLRNSVQSPNILPKELASGKSLGAKIGESVKRTVNLVHNLLQYLDLCNNFVYLIRWDGEKDIQKWKVTHPNGLPIKIEQSMHQMGLSEDYVILVDTAFKFLLDEIIPASLDKKYESVERFLRNLIDRPQLPDTTIYIVRRADLKPKNKRVKAKKLVIQRETTHFLVDYKNPNQQITLHVGHVCAWDTAEWIRQIDFEDDNSDRVASNNLPHMFGMTVGPLDISRMGCYTINGETGEVVRADLTGVDADCSHNQNCNGSKDSSQEYCKYTWGPALYAYRDYPPSGHLEDIYWSCVGCWEDILTDYAFHMYENYKYRVVPTSEMRNLAKQGIKSNLLRLHVKPLENLKDGENRLEIQDVYEFDTGYFVNSPQFVPRKEDGGSTDGYIACVVYYGADGQSDNGNEIWIFDAADLKKGPLCKLYHPKLNFGITVHTAWLPHIGKRKASYNIPVEEDYQYLVDQQPDEIKDLFTNWVYKKKEPQGNCNGEIS